VRVETVEVPSGEIHRVGSVFPVRVKVNLGAVSPDDVEVQLCHGVLDSMGDLAEPRALALHPEGNLPPNGAARSVLYSGKVPCYASGQFGFTVRVLPKHANLPHSFEPGLVTWG
jgi:starch phosphorylase